MTPAMLSLAERTRRLAWPRTSPFYGGNTGSNPVGDAKCDFFTGKSPSTLKNELFARELSGLRRKEL
jgi:hypothetical protein